MVNPLRTTGYTLSHRL